MGRILKSSIATKQESIQKPSQSYYNPCIQTSSIAMSKGLILKSSITTKLDYVQISIQTQ